MMRLDFKEQAIAEAVIKKNKKIAEVATLWGVSKTTVRRYMDKYTEESLRVKREETIDNAYLVHLELHVGNDTRHLHKLIYAESKDAAEKIMEAMRPDYRGNETPSYQLQIKGGPFKLTDNLWMLEEY